MMMSTNRPLDPATLSLQNLILADQLAAVRRSMSRSIPVSVVLALISLLVAIHYGHAFAGTLWFAVTCIVNVARMILCRFPIRATGDQPGEPANLDPPSVARHLHLHSVMAAISGCVWMFVAVLCDGYTAPQTVFYLTVLCGMTAGAITAGFAYARMPICYIVPVLLSVAACLVYAGGFDRICLAAITMIYLVALTRGALESEGLFRQSSRLKHEAHAMARSLEAARDHANEAATEMGHRAAHDALTGLLNRNGFMQEVASLPSLNKPEFTLMLLDLDGFKSINDAFGHKSGDRVLVEVGRRLRESLGSAPLVARWGGDEFALLYETALSADDPATVATKLIAAISIPFASFDAGRIGVSIGICVSRECDVDEMLVRADAALYKAKSEGRNRHYLFDDDLRKHLEMRRDIERDLAKALANDQLEVWFQPILGDGGRRLTDLEALIRWRHPRHGWIPPTDLVAVASLSGLAELLFRYILRDVCTMMQMLRAMNLDYIRVAMNMSPREMSQLPVDDLIISKLRKLDLPASMLEIEITEDTAKDIRSVQSKLAALTREGVRIAIDDFGVGYSSMSSLRQLRVSRIKIDRSFVHGIAESADDRKVVQSMLNLGKSLDIEVVAEGVETETDLRVLRRLGCATMQGYYFAKPMPQHEALEWANRSSSVIPMDSRTKNVPG
jgi:diguanylate cyclase (GGDEF)-like protein